MSMIDSQAHVSLYVDSKLNEKRTGKDLWPENRGLAEICDADAGWIAGLIDGEGTIGMTAKSAHHHLDGSLRSHNFSARCGIAGTSREMLEEVQRIAGFGSISVSTRASGCKQGYVWHVPVPRLKGFLQRVTPLLRLKRQQALLVLVYLDMQDSGRGTAARGLPLALVPHAIDIYHRLRALNRRGTTIEEEIEFSVREPKPRDRTCTEDGCVMRRYSTFRWCYRHWLTLKEPEIKHCEYCGKEMESRHPQKRFCSDRCGWRHNKDVRKGPDRERHQPITEEQVQQAIALLATGKHNQTSAAKAVGADRTALGQILRGRARKDLKVELPDPEILAKGHEVWQQQRNETGEGLRDATCDVCGTAFKALSARHRLCGNAECERQANNQRQRAKYQAKVAAEPKGVKGHMEPRTLTCPVCNNDFVSTHPMQVFCSLDCRAVARSQGRYKKIEEA